MTTQTIEEAVEERFNGSNIFWKVILKNLTPETISFIKYDYTQALQAQRDAGAREEKKSIYHTVNYEKKVLLQAQRAELERGLRTYASLTKGSYEASNNFFWNLAIQDQIDSIDALIKELTK